MTKQHSLLLYVNR